jgi:hypothetical protein
MANVLGDLQGRGGEGRGPDAQIGRSMQLVDGVPLDAVEN